MPEHQFLAFYFQPKVQTVISGMHSFYVLVAPKMGGSCALCIRHEDTRQSLSDLMRGGLIDLERTHGRLCMESLRVRICLRDVEGMTSSL